MKTLTLSLLSLFSVVCTLHVQVHICSARQPFLIGIYHLRVGWLLDYSAPPTWSSFRKNHSPTHNEPLPPVPSLASSSIG
jgi:hypothetical protein